AAFNKYEDNIIGFRVGEYDKGYDLIIDPTYQWHTFYGSANHDECHSIAVDSSSNVYVTGYSPATWNGDAGQAPLHAYSGNADIFVLKMNDAAAALPPGWWGPTPPTVNAPVGSGSGSVTWSFIFDYLYTTIEFMASPSSGNVFTGWGGDCSVCGSQPICVISVPPGGVSVCCPAVFTQDGDETFVDEGGTMTFPLFPTNSINDTDI
ncbi:MAG: SBBP repeat-containing protein, partial [Nitrospirae bacterium]|nr:SBBP repeat-containing protein [Nitrospirota bacterium]